MNKIFQIVILNAVVFLVSLWNQVSAEWTDNHGCNNKDWYTFYDNYKVNGSWACIKNWKGVTKNYSIIQQITFTWKYAIYLEQIPDTGSHEFQKYLQKKEKQIISDVLKFSSDTETSYTIGYTLMSTWSIKSIKIDIYWNSGTRDGNSRVYIFNYDSKKKKLLSYVNFFDKKQKNLIKKNINTTNWSNCITKDSQLNLFSIHTNSLNLIDEVIFYEPCYKMFPTLKYPSLDIISLWYVGGDDM